eukprot:359329_1
MPLGKGQMTPFMEFRAAESLILHPETRVLYMAEIPVEMNPIHEGRTAMQETSGLQAVRDNERFEAFFPIWCQWTHHHAHHIQSILKATYNPKRTTSPKHVSRPSTINAPCDTASCKLTERGSNAMQRTWNVVNHQDIQYTDPTRNDYWRNDCHNRCPIRNDDIYQGYVFAFQSIISFSNNATSTVQLSGFDTTSFDLIAPFTSTYASTNPCNDYPELKLHSIAVLLFTFLVIMTLLSLTKSTHRMPMVFFWVRFTGCKGSYYIFESAAKNWYQADAFCQQTYGTHLATIWNDEAARELLTLTTADFWIGLNDITEEGVWVYVDGNTVNSLCGGDCGGEPGQHLKYKYWVPGQPNDAYNQDCGIVRLSDGAGISSMLHDVACTTRENFPFACNVINRLVLTLDFEVTGTINLHEIKYYYVDFSSDIQGTVVLKSCSNFCPDLYWYDSNMNVLPVFWNCSGVNYFGDNCGDVDDLCISNPGKGTYYAGIGGCDEYEAGSYKLSMFLTTDAPSANPTPPPTIPSDLWFNLQNKETKKCIFQAMGTLSSITCDVTTSQHNKQKWMIYGFDSNAEYYRLKNRDTEKCLTNTDEQYSEQPANPGFWYNDCQDDDSQFWKGINSADGYFMLKNKKTQKCVYHSNDGRFGITTCLSSKMNQFWRDVNHVWLNDDVLFFWYDDDQFYWITAVAVMVLIACIVYVVLVRTTKSEYVKVGYETVVEDTEEEEE